MFGAHQSLGIKDGVVFEHVIDGAGQLDRQHGVGLELVPVHPGGQPLIERADEGGIALGNDGRLAKGPAQIGIAELGAAQALELAGAGDGALDQAAIAEEIFDGGEAGDVADLVEQRQAQVLANAGDGLEQDEVAAGVGFGEFEQLGFHGGDLDIEVADQGQMILVGELADGIHFGRLELFRPAVAVGTGERGQVVGELLGLECGSGVRRAARRSSGAGAGGRARGVGRRDGHSRAG